MSRIHVWFLIALSLSACERPAATTAAGAAVPPAEATAIATTPHAASTTGSAPSPEIQAALDGFRQNLGEPPTELGSGARPSRDALVEAFVRALEAADSAAFAPMMITRAEFAWLYYPFTKYVRPPYAMDPDVLWTLQVQNAEKGISRALREYAGRALGFAGYACAAEPETAGVNRVWEDCVVHLNLDGGKVTARLFGSILERRGRFKFMSYANNL
jgi:hypothetical protein